MDRDPLEPSLILSHLNRIRNFGDSDSCCVLCLGTRLLEFPQSLGLGTGAGKAQGLRNYKTRVAHLNWKSSYSQMLCKLFDMELKQMTDEVQSTLLEGSYCEDCLEIVLDVEFVMNNINALEKRLLQLKARATKIMKLADVVKLEEPEPTLDLNYFDVKHENEDNALNPLLDIPMDLDDGTNSKEVLIDFSHEYDENKEIKVTTSQSKVRNTKDSDGSSILTYTRSGRPVRSTRNRTEQLDTSESEADMSAYTEDDINYQKQDILRVKRKMTPTSHPTKIGKGSSRKMSESDKPASTTVKTKRTKKSRTCEFCGKMLKTTDGLRHHIETLHVGNRTKPSCSYCGKLFSNVEEQGLHEQLHRDNSNYPWICVLCPDLQNYPTFFQLKSELQKHVLKHHEENAFRCSKCPAVVLTAPRLHVHMQKHRGCDSGKYVCKVCSYVTSAPSFLKAHMVKHDENPKRFKCDQEGCDVNFKHLISLRHHQRVYHSKTPFQKLKCDTCSKTFNSQNAMDKHAVLHLDIRPFMCEKCPAAFKTQGHLRQHNRIHRKDLPGRVYKFKPRRTRVGELNVQKAL